MTSGSARAQSAAGLPPVPAQEISLKALLQRVLERNESLQSRMLEFEAHRRRYRAEYGAFEPELYGSAGREVNNRKNTAEQQISLLTPRFQETNNVYEAGLEALIPTGARVRLGYSLRDLQNNLQVLRNATNGEYQSFFGLSAVQPLLKNIGAAGVMAGIRLAAISNKIAFQEYRRGMMNVVSATEASYWNLYLAQEQVRFFEESVKTAGTILKDNQTRLEAGKGAEIEVLESESGLGLRRAKLQEARQKALESANRVTSLFAEQVPPGGARLHAADTPRIQTPPQDYEQLRQTAFNLNPDYLIAEEKIQQDRVRLGFARNQRLPELNLKGSYGMNGLGRTPGFAWDDIQNQDAPAWFIGAEFRIPLLGGVKSRNDVIATRLQLQSSELSLRGLETELANAMNSAWHKIESTRQNIRSYQSSVRYNRALLDSALTRLEAGKLESRKVLEIEADLLQAEFSEVESMVRFEFATMELDMIQGSLLQNRGLELSQRELQLATASLGSSRLIGDTEYQRALKAKSALHQAAGSNEPQPAETGSALQYRLQNEMRELQIKDEVKQGFERPTGNERMWRDFDDPGKIPVGNVDYEALRQQAREKAQAVDSTKPSPSTGKP
jgi:outer membrane protein TolC